MVHSNRIPVELQRCLAKPVGWIQNQLEPRLVQITGVFKIKLLVAEKLEHEGSLVTLSVYYYFEQYF
jgi:hypothetical protein